MGPPTSLVLEDSALIANIEYGLFVAGDRETATLARVVVADTTSKPDGTRGRGVNVQGGASPWVRLEGVSVSGLPGAALYFRGPGTYAVLDSTLSDSAFASGTFPVPGTGDVEVTGPPMDGNDCAGPTLLVEPYAAWVPFILEAEAVE